MPANGDRRKSRRSNAKRLSRRARKENSFNFASAIASGFACGEIGTCVAKCESCASTRFKKYYESYRHVENIAAKCSILSSERTRGKLREPSICFEAIFLVSVSPPCGSSYWIRQAWEPCATGAFSRQPVAAFRGGSSLALPSGRSPEHAPRAARRPHPVPWSSL